MQNHKFYFHILDLVYPRYRLFVKGDYYNDTQKKTDKTITRSDI